MVSRKYAIAQFSAVALSAGLAASACIDDRFESPTRIPPPSSLGATEAPTAAGASNTLVMQAPPPFSPPSSPLPSTKPPPPPPPVATRPTFGSTVVASSPPPPISGGTLIVAPDGHTAIASDPDRDLVYLVDVTAKTLTATIALQPGDEPGRLTADESGRVHVALRSGGALVTIDWTQRTVVARRAVCPAPRGVTWDASTDLVWVACATGELVALPSGGGPAVRSLVLERDLRDVIADNGVLSVTKFRSAEILRVGGDGTVLGRTMLPSAQGTLSQTASSAAHVAWRAVAAPSGRILVVHQEESTSSTSTNAGGYGGLAGPIVESELSVVSTSEPTTTQTLSRVVLPVDVALCPDATCAFVVSAGAAFSAGLPNLTIANLGPTSASAAPSLPSFAGAQPTAVAFDAAGDLLVQSREPATLWVVPKTGTATSVSLSDVSRADTGHAIFHTQAGGLIACASCHPEGRDDGKVWLLNGLSRRTPSLLGTIKGTAPYHWPGDKADFTALVNDVYTQRMSGASLDSFQLTALKHWVETLAAPPVPSWVDSQAAQRGRTLFEGPAQCSACHSGDKLTNNATLDVGTGSSQGANGPGTGFQVPPLVGVGWRTPLLHDGCAATIADRFGKCSTPQHGSTSKLSPQDISDLTAYLESL